MAATIAIVDTASMTWRLDNIVKISLCAVVNLKKSVQQKLAKPPSNNMLFTNVNSASCAETISLWHSSLKIIKLDTVVNVPCVSETLLKMSATIYCLILWKWTSAFPCHCTNILPDSVHSSSMVALRTNICRHTCSSIFKIFWAVDFCHVGRCWD